MAFEPLNDLERALVAATGGDAEAQAAFEQALLEGDLWAASREAPQDDHTLALIAARGPDGQGATALFTARERVTEVLGDQVHVASLPGRQMIEMVKANPAVINPGLGYGVRFDSAALNRLVGTPLPANRDREPFALSDPNAVPPELLAGLTTALTPEKGVLGAWLAEARWADIAEPGLLLDLRLSSAAPPVPLLMQQALDGVDLGSLRLDVRSRIVEGSDIGAANGLEIVRPA